MSHPIAWNDRPSARTADAFTGEEPCLGYGEGDALYVAMLEDIDQATDAIRLESDIFGGDEIGWRQAFSTICGRGECGGTASTDWCQT